MFQKRNKGSVAMVCPRCDGKMIPDVFQDIRDDTGSIAFKGWRCPTCGEIIDPVILANRKNRPGPIESKTRRRFGITVGR
jgi:ribosomal protein S27AE